MIVELQSIQEGKEYIENSKRDSIKRFYLSFKIVFVSCCIVATTKCLVMQPRQHRFSPTLKLDFHVGGNVIEVVEQWPHLGPHRCTDDADIMNRRNSMIGQINNVLCYFGKLPSQVKSSLLYAYCSSLYGCELWDLWNSNIANVCVAWRKALRRVWNLPLNTHSYFLFELSHALPVYDAVCKRVLSFISKCVNSDCDLVSFSARHAVLYGCTLCTILIIIIIITMYTF